MAGLKVIKAPNRYEKLPNEVAVFLAGGCSSYEWRQRVIDRLNQYDVSNMVVYDPYCENIESQYIQVAWEYDYLNNYLMDKCILSFYFDQYTNQPVTMYELGRATALVQLDCIKVHYKGKTTEIPVHCENACVVSYHENAPLRTDILIQCGLAKLTAKHRTPEEHADEILAAYHKIQNADKVDTTLASRLRIVQGDILDCAEDIIVQQVNCMGKMGSGLAKQIKEKFPVIYTEYVRYCDSKLDATELLGQALICYAGKDKTVASVFGQYRYGRDAYCYTSYSALESGLKKVADYAAKTNQTVAIPYKLGCGLGGGDWEKVSEMIAEILPNAVIYRKD